MPADRLRHTLAGLQFPLDAPARATVQRCVYDYVDAMKVASWPAERVVIGLKRIAEESGVRSAALATESGRAARADLLMDLVAWSIEHYYAMEKRPPEAQ